MTANVLGEVDGFQIFEHVVEPLERLHLRTNPEKVHFFENDEFLPRFALINVGISAARVHLFENVFQDGGEGRDADASADEDSDVVKKPILRRSSVRTVDKDRQRV